MRVLLTGKMKDGTKIQREDWSENYSFYPFGCAIGAYPKATASTATPYGQRRGREFRVQLDFETTGEAEEAFFMLESGRKTLKDYAANLFDVSDIEYI